MKKCQYLYCTKKVIGRQPHAKYCSNRCLRKYHALRKEDEIIEQLPGSIDAEKWVRTYLNSSFNAMEELIGLNTQSQKHAVNFKQPTQSVTIMSKL